MYVLMSVNNTKVKTYYEYTATLVMGPHLSNPKATRKQ